MASALNFYELNELAEADANHFNPLNPPTRRKEQKRIANEVRRIIELKKKAKEMTRRVVSSVVQADEKDNKFMTLIVDYC